eukprot:15047029-Heterocapsa_arctica.AAC.1
MATLATFALAASGGSEVLHNSGPASLKVHACLAAHGLVVRTTRTVLCQVQFEPQCSRGIPSETS